MSHLSVLLVEDDPLYASIARALLDEQAEQASGTITFEQVATIADALDVLAERTFDCVLLDLNLPDARRGEGAHRLREARADLPVIVLTADRSEETERAVREAGAAGYVVKGSEDEHALWTRLRDVA